MTAFTDRHHTDDPPPPVGCRRCGGTGQVPAGPWGGVRMACSACGGQGSVEWRDPGSEVMRQATAERKFQGVYPGMCIDPELCRGRGSCPRERSCCE